MTRKMKSEEVENRSREDNDEERQMRSKAAGEISMNEENGEE